MGGIGKDDLALLLRDPARQAIILCARIKKAAVTPASIL